jgi:uncharacterized protein YjiS (DUF1127 family)
MPPHQMNLTSEATRDAAGLGFDPSIALASHPNHASAAARPDASIAALRDALSEKDAAGPPAVSTRSIPGLLKRYWRAFQERRRRQSLRATLYDLSERELMDIGIAPGEIEHIVARRAIERLKDDTAHLLLSRGVM